MHRLGPNASSHAALRSSSNAVLRAESHRPNPFRVSSSPLSMSPSRFQEFKKHNVTDVVRVSNPTYGTQPLADAHIAVHVRGQPLSRSGSATACARHGGRTSLPSRRPQKDPKSLSNAPPSRRLGHCPIPASWALLRPCPSLPLARRSSPWPWPQPVPACLMNPPPFSTFAGVAVCRRRPAAPRGHRKLSGSVQPGLWSQRNDGLQGHDRRALHRRAGPVRACRPHNSRARVVPAPAHPSLTRLRACVHRCRAPVLVAVALVESGMEPLDAVEYVRKRRRGAINSKQIKYVESYRKRSQRGSCHVQ